MTREGNANTARGAGEFVTQVINNARAAGATGEITMRFDSGFFSRAVRDTASQGNVRICITTRMSKRLKQVIAAIPEETWTSIPYWLEGGADVAEVKYRAFARDRQDVRLIVGRTKPTPGSQLALFRDYDYHAFITDRQGETLFLEADHRAHAQIELVIKDLKGGSGWNHVPSRYKNANAVWLALV
ncbi:transposase DDE domain protein [Acidithrix ferrooxidans]|uniref:Transposase DDE domain protein n=1 Tax=Acidithrix ferrooxidans TaxID=1280514 RepID=A0A0D8HEK8_9ACTN|nr:transposase DDE domain protein [Acidithrix ferrooxidans]